MNLSNLCDLMCIKRLCLPSNTNIDDIRDGHTKPSVCFGDKAIHSSTCFNLKKGICP